jgi:hypothetical protein
MGMGRGMGGGLGGLDRNETECCSVGEASAVGERGRGGAGRRGREEGAERGRGY